jgi:glutamate N-acetyltransferase/amino-acid N-acetyltransferase
MTIRSLPDQGVTAPTGFLAAGVAAGIKASGAPDVALLVAEDGPASAAALFTVNQVRAAPVVVSAKHLAASAGRVRAILVNSGCANACTGAQGLATAHASVTEVARALGCSDDEVLVASTGVIGVHLDREALVRGIGMAVRALDRVGHPAAHAIMTTDLGPKEHAVEVETPQGAFRVGGMAKGAGMIEPMLATMLGFLTTDAQVAPAILDRALREVADRTFNAITVDGECSTNDTLAVLASGRSRVEVTEALYPALVAGLEAVARDLAVAIVRGGEGATKLVSIRVTGAETATAARRAAKTIANSPLVKTALHGGDPNWGRLVAAAGRSGVPFALDKAVVEVGTIVLFQDGQPFDDRAPQAAEYLTANEIDVHLDLGTGGTATATVWTCDLSAEYVRINGEYRT